MFRAVSDAPCIILYMGGVDRFIGSNEDISSSTLPSQTGHFTSTLSKYLDTSALVTSLAVHKYVPIIITGL